jgi:hypothetical protein
MAMARLACVPPEPGSAAGFPKEKIIPQKPPPDEVRSFEPPIEESLRNYGATLIRLALSKEQLALLRVVSMESAKFPELGKHFCELGPKRGEEILAAYLAKQAEKGRLSNEDTNQMAQHFMSLITGGAVRHRLRTAGGALRRCLRIPVLGPSGRFFPNLDRSFLRFAREEGWQD